MGATNYNQSWINWSDWGSGQPDLQRPGRRRKLFAKEPRHLERHNLGFLAQFASVRSRADHLHHCDHHDQRQRGSAALSPSSLCAAPRHPPRGARKLQPAILRDRRRHQFRQHAAFRQCRQPAPSGIAHQDHDALSAVRAARGRQAQAQLAARRVSARFRPGPHQARAQARADDPGRGCDRRRW